MVIRDLKEISKHIKIHKDKDEEKVRSKSRPVLPEPVDAGKDSDQELFYRAMEGVRPISGVGGREVVAVKHHVSNIKKSRKNSRKDKYLEKFLKGDIEFELEFTDEYIQGNVKGLDPRIFRKLKAGSFSPESHLDLHGLNSDDAYVSLISFVKKNYLQGKRCLLVIPGRGKNSPLGRSILKENLQFWITRDPLKRVVLAFCSAIPKHGGAGAVYILLRKYKKHRGKIFWERY